MWLHYGGFLKNRCENPKVLQSWNDITLHGNPSFSVFERSSTRQELRMVSSGMLRRVALVRTDVSEEPGASFIRVTKIDEQEQHKLQLATDVRASSSVTSVLTRATRHNIPEDGILHSHRRENLKSNKDKNAFLLQKRLQEGSWMWRASNSNQITKIKCGFAYRVKRLVCSVVLTVPLALEQSTVSATGIYTAVNLQCATYCRIM
jgi:hypothetical protein